MRTAGRRCLGISTPIEPLIFEDEAMITSVFAHRWKKPTTSESPSQLSYTCRRANIHVQVETLQTRTDWCLLHRAGTGVLQHWLSLWSGHPNNAPEARFQRPTSKNLETIAPLISVQAKSHRATGACDTKSRNAMNTNLYRAKTGVVQRIQSPWSWHPHKSNSFPTIWRKSYTAALYVSSLILIDLRERLIFTERHEHLTRHSYYIEYHTKTWSVAAQRRLSLIGYSPHNSRNVVNNNEIPSKSAVRELALWAVGRGKFNESLEVKHRRSFISCSEFQ